MKQGAEISLNAGLHHVMHKENILVQFLEWARGVPWIQWLKSTEFTTRAMSHPEFIDVI